MSFYTKFNSAMGIDEGDAEMIKTVLDGSKKIKERKIVFLINSPGGDPLAAEKIIKLLSEYSDNDYWIVVPYTAKSAATMICFGASKIIMSPTSELGPIDLQIQRDDRLVPAHSIIKAYDKLMNIGLNLKDDQQIDPILQQLQNFDPSDIEMFRSINELSSDIAKKVLKKCMMKGVTLKEIEKVIKIFIDPEKSKTHGRPIFFSDIEKVDKNGYFKIERLDMESDLWQTITSYHMRVVHSLRVNKRFKLIESEETSLSA